ncbi:hypothetical protein [Pelagibacterium halotolerans]|uniref:hypothetical protein n=1 Tax=Pelagibacterium halotolerans TaxID=531813 RepID=UPI00384F4590
MTEQLSHASASCTLLWIGNEGRISDFHAETPADGTALIATALQRLRDIGCTRVLAPLGRDTWSAYRLVVETDGTPAFPGEPDNPPFFVECFAANGFSAVAHYVSTIDMAPAPPTRPCPADLVIDEWNAARPEQDLAAIHAIANQAFAEAPYFAPIDLERFTAIHRPLLSSLPPRYCLLGRDAATRAIVSCLLGYPSAAGLILKSLMAVRPGAGSALVDAFYARAIADGYRAVVHALMHEDNRSTRMSAKRNACIFRRYALFGRSL